MPEYKYSVVQLTVQLLHKVHHLNASKRMYSLLMAVKAILEYRQFRLILLMVCITLHLNKIDLMVMDSVRNVMLLGHT
ncbi:unnamed protein product [Schistosoma mattheei]|uniref:Uncharacterized protein n=1 Tax=Schistosoma mattheei TaxID=31246 RepID=A0A183P0W1_9TREM|nr:unnamed protein product [Schistosoma mattheei]